MKIQPKRHIAKTITYRITSSFIGFVVLYVTTGDYRVGIAFSGFEFFYKPFLYFLHERVWYKWIKYGLIEEGKTKENREK